MTRLFRLRLKPRWIFFSVLAFVAVVWAVSLWDPQAQREKNRVLSKKSLSNALAESVLKSQFPKTGDVTWGSRPATGDFYYSLDLVLQNRMEKLFQQYKPDHGAFVALDPRTGAILSLVGYTRDGKLSSNLALKGSFPAASVFKIITAAAAIDKGTVSPDTVFAFNGANHTLYKSNVVKDVRNRWTRRMTLKEAFAKSVNTVFGKVGISNLAKEDLQGYAERFGFNQEIPLDLPVEVSRFAFKNDEPYGLAEVASGFNRVVLMSPLQGAMIAASIANDGLMMEPYLVEKFVTAETGPIYLAEPHALGQIITPQTSRNLREMMQATVRNGTSQKSFRELVRKSSLHGLEIGGKTGSLTGTDPRGKYDWFVGYAGTGDKRIALAALTINEENWRVKSSYLARLAIENYFAPELRARVLTRR